MTYADDYSGWGNEVLYRMCAERPKHIDCDSVKAKLWLIGRAYSASIERKAGDNFSIDNAARLVVDSDLDLALDELRSVNRPNTENLPRILAAHKLLTDLFVDATGMNKRSLASKYLHFHCPRAFFIFDSIANRELRKRMARRRFITPPNFDNSYSAFCVRCIWYRDTVFEKQIGQLVTARRLDMELLGYGAP